MEYPTNRDAYQRPPDAPKDTAQRLAAALSAMYVRDDIADLLPPPSPTGVPARALFAAAGSSARDASYDEVGKTLMGMTPGSSAIVASSWAPDSGRSGGHAYLAVRHKLDGKVYLLEPWEWSEWPPRWGSGAVARVVVGYLDACGYAVEPL